MSQQPYQSSLIFGALKVQKDEIDVNLTTSQYMEKLDGYLYSALYPILENTNYVEAFIIGLIGWQEKHYRRRVSLLTKREFITKAIAWLLRPTKAEKVKLLIDLKFDRGVLLTLCQSFLIENKPFSLVARKITLSQEDLAVLVSTTKKLETSTSQLSCALASTQYRVEQALTYRSSILSKYYRLALLAAKRDYTKYFNHRISLDDMVAEYLLATSRAIDKCDYERGPLTTHVQNWFFTARSQCQKKYDTSLKEESKDFSEAYEATSLSDRTNAQNMQYLLDETTVNSVEEDLGSSQCHTVRLLAKIADPKGLARRYLGIEEFLTVYEKQILGLRP